MSMNSIPCGNHRKRLFGNEDLNSDVDPFCDNCNTTASTNDLHLMVVGVACTLHRDDAMAQYIDDGRHLIEMDLSGEDRYCNYVIMTNDGEEGSDMEQAGKKLTSTLDSNIVLMDRYDARSLLIGHSCSLQATSTNMKDHHRKSNSTTMGKLATEGESDLIEKELYLERYGRWLEEGDTAVATLDPILLEPHPNKETSSCCQSVVMEKDSTTDNQQNGLNGRVDRVVIRRNRRQADIIQKTADTISKCGPQLEVLLKLKQATNPDFAFLFENHIFYPYFVKMKKNKCESVDVSSEQEDASQIVKNDKLVHLKTTMTENHASSEALAGLNAYSSDDSDDDNNENHDKAFIDSTSSKTSFICSDVVTAISVTKATTQVDVDQSHNTSNEKMKNDVMTKRLEKVKMFKDYFMNKMKE